MKKLIFNVSLLVFLVFGSFVTGAGEIVELQGGGTTIAIVTKQSTSYLEVPSKYINQEGEFLLPLNLELHQNGEKKTYYRLTAKNRAINLANLGVHEGDYIIKITVGEVVEIQKIKF